MVSSPMGCTDENQDYERLSTGTKFALRQWLKALYTSEEMPAMAKADSLGSVFHMITHEGHKPAKAPFLG